MHISYQWTFYHHFNSPQLRVVVPIHDKKPQNKKTKIFKRDGNKTMSQPQKKTHLFKFLLGVELCQKLTQRNKAHDEKWKRRRKGC